MKYSRFEDLPVWQDSAELARKMYEFTAAEPLRRHRGLRDQLESAALSVSNNVAEGFERGTTKELLAFLYIARGSAGEVRSMLHVLNGWSGFGNFKSQIADLKGRSKKSPSSFTDGSKISKILRLRQRHFDDKQRTIYTGKKEREDFLEEIRRITEAAAEKRKKGRE